MPTPTTASLHVDAALTNISVAFMQNPANFVAGQVFPIVPVKKQSDKYHVFSRADFNRDEMDKRANATESKGGGFTVSQNTYFCEKYSLHKDISDEDLANADEAISLEVSTAQYLAQKALIKRERDFVATYMAASVWSNDYTGVSGAPGAGEFKQWNDDASDPIADISTARMAILTKTGCIPNTLVLGAQVEEKLTNHPDIIDRIKYGQSKGEVAMGSLSALAAIFKVERVLVSYGVYNSAAEGATEVGALITGKTAMLVHTPSTPGLMQPAAGYTFAWDAAPLGGLNAQGSIKKYRMDELDAERLEINSYWDMVKVSSELGSYFASAVA